MLSSSLSFLWMMQLLSTSSSSSSRCNIADAASTECIGSKTSSSLSRTKSFSAVSSSCNAVVTKKDVFMNDDTMTTTTLPNMFLIQSLRGGGDDGKKRRKKRSGSSSSSGGGTRRRRKKKTVEEEEESSEGKRVIDSAMKEKDAAVALGDAIRDRANQLRNDPPPPPPTNTIDTTLASIGLALGNTDYKTPPSSNTEDATMHAKHLIDSQDDIELQQLQQNNEASNNMGGGVQASPTAVLANYFLHSHGGSHGIQCLLSFCSIFAGLASLLLSSSKNLHLKVILLQRALLCAMTKHTGGLLSASITSARSIQRFGWRNVKGKLEELALDPVSQYAFYCAFMMIWIPKPSSIGTEVGVWWMQDDKLSNIVVCSILGPILLREVVSTVWVISDIIVLLHSTSSSSGKSPSALLFKSCSSIINALMSLLFTPSKWRNATSSTKQLLLAKFVANVSILFEIVTFLIVVIDALRGFFVEYALKDTSERKIGLWNVLKRLVYARLFINFMLVRRKKIYSVERE